MDSFIPYIPYLKALHIVGFVAWFAALFYLVRLFVYDIEAGERPEQEREILQDQLRVMQNRLYSFIANPAMMVTWTAGILMLIINTAYLSEGWMHIKLTLLILLLVYHLLTKRWMRKLAKGNLEMSASKMRWMNEIPTLFLVAIVFLAVLGNNNIGLLPVAVIVLLFGIMIYIGGKAYAKSRRQNET